MLVKLNDLPGIRKKFKNQTIVFAGGVFDVFHTTHIRALKKLRSYGDIVIVGVVSDKRVRERKGSKRPILYQAERCEIVDSIKYVDFVLSMPDPSKTKPYPTMIILEKIKADVFVSVDKKWLAYKDMINSLGTKLKIVKRIHPTSSTSIIDRILNKHKN